MFDGDGVSHPNVKSLNHSQVIDPFPATYKIEHFASVVNYFVASLDVLSVACREPCRVIRVEWILFN